ncbi:hypothetical protein GOP47_0028446 [Adiantum capillus-veneris]|nr:hypothetical protein GOP47_0028446 [Adiantum capillus-veneris]
MDSSKLLASDEPKKLLVPNEPKKPSSTSLPNVALRICGVALVMAAVLGSMLTLVYYMDKEDLQKTCYLLIIVYGVYSLAMTIMKVIVCKEYLKH